MNLTPIAISVLNKRYLKKDNAGNPIETPEDMFRRVAHNIASTEKPEWEEKFYSIMTNLEFLPNSPTLMNAGRELQQLSACFVLPVEDSIEGIFEAIKQGAIIHKTGGGTGYSFSRLRPKNDIVKSTTGISSGPVSFMNVFNAATEVVKQGSTRRGANMGILRVDHPDILEFITCKSEEGQLSNFNISIAITDDFMDKLSRKDDYELINPHTNKVVEKLNTQKVWDLISTMAWKNGEPGIIFIDVMNKFNPTPELGNIESTNPCVSGDTLITTDKGLIEINKLIEEHQKIKILTKNMTFEVPNDIFYSGVQDIFEIEAEAGIHLKCTFDHKILTTNGWKEMRELSKDDYILQYAFWEIGGLKYLTPRKILKKEYAGRVPVYDISEPITNSFVANGIIVHNCGEQPLLPYESCNLGSINLSKFVKNKEIDWDKLKDIIKIAVRFLDNVIDKNVYPLEKIKTATLLTRKIGLGVMGWADMLIKLDIPYNSEEAIKIAEIVMDFINKTSKIVSTKIALEKEAPYPTKTLGLRNATTTTIAPTGTISMIAGCSSGIEPLFALEYTKENVLDNQSFKYVHPELGKHTKEVLITSHEISWEWHVRMQAAFQKYTDNAVSKTINFPNSATVEDIKNAYLLAFRSGCKGITIYRDGSRHKQVLSLGNKPIPKVIPRSRPKVTEGTTEKIITGDGKLYLTINKDQYGPCEIFTNIGKHGSDVSSWAQALGRLISICLRSGIPLEIIVKQLQGIISRPVWVDGKKILSVPDAIGQSLNKYIEEIEETKIIKANCPDCGAELDIDNSCLVCKICGYSKCQ